MFIPYDERQELYHHGILGMHWGIRRYQPYPQGSKKGKEVGAALKVKQRQSKADKKAAKNAEKIKKINTRMGELETKTKLATAEANYARQQQAQTEARISAKASKYESRRRSTKLAPFKTEYGKQKAITSGNAKKVARYAKYMTNDEYKRAIDRCNLSADLHLHQVSNLTQAGKKVLDFIGTAADMTTKGITLHDNVATIKNARLKAMAESEGVELDTSKLMKKWKSDPVNYKNVAERIRAADDRQRFYNTHGYDYTEQTDEKIKKFSKYGKSSGNKAGVKRKMKLKRNP